MSNLNDYISASNYIVFFGGAGVSTESGIPDFRSIDGLYNQLWQYPPEMILSHNFFKNRTADFYKFYKKRLLHLDAQPNQAHLGLAALEKAGRLKAVITQNIDGLHQKAGSKNVLELHGSVWRNYCLDCKTDYEVAIITNAPDTHSCLKPETDCEDFCASARKCQRGVPKGTQGGADDAIAQKDRKQSLVLDGNEYSIPICQCGGVIRPDVVLFDEPLDDDIMVAAMDHIARADMLIIGGTSLGVYPAAGLLQVFRGERLVLINKSATHMDNAADLIIRENIGDVFAHL